MKLSKLYSNKPDIFGPIDFVSGLNVVMAEIRLPENKDKDTHNLGKTTLGRVLDFGFLAVRDAKFFLFRHFEMFKDFIFFLEIELADASFLTVRRGVEEATKISFKKHEAGHQDFTSLPDTGWDHLELPFERARDMLDSLLDWRALKPYPYRKELGYLQEERAEIEARLKDLNAELNTLGKKRSDMLAFLSSTDVFSKYKQVSDELITLRADITSLERQRGFLTRLQQLRTDIRTINEDREHLQTQIEQDVEQQNSDPTSLFSTIRLFFSEIVEEVIDRKALLSVSPNKEGHLEFKVEILDESGYPTSADRGHTYRKLLC